MPGVFKVCLTFAHPPIFHDGQYCEKEHSVRCVFLSERLEIKRRCWVGGAFCAEVNSQLLSLSIHVCGARRVDVY